SPRVEVNMFFFFSSRRRHTRSKRDWSSDVCSSDLDPYGEIGTGGPFLCPMAGREEREPHLENAHPAGYRRRHRRVPHLEAVPARSEERRVGKECRGGWGREGRRENGSRTQ